MQENQNQDSKAKLSHSKSFVEFLRSFNESEGTIGTSGINKFGLTLDGFDLCVTDLNNSYNIDRSFKEFDLKSNPKTQIDLFPQSPKMCKPWKLEETYDNFDIALGRLDEIIKLLNEKIDATEKIIRCVNFSKKIA